MLDERIEIRSHFPKIKKVLHDSGIIYSEFSGKIYLEINKGGISKLRRIEEIK